MLSHRPDDDVNMICHHAPGTEVITLAFKMCQRIANDGRYFRALHQAGPVTCIERLIHALVVMIVEFATQLGGGGCVACIFSLLNACEKLVFLLLVLLENGGWQGIGKAESDGISGPVLMPMREVS